MVKAGTFLYSDRIQKENIQRYQSWKSLILKTLELIFWINGLNESAGFYFELSWYWRFPLCWDSISLETQQQKLLKQTLHFKAIKGIKNFFFQ